MADENPKIEEHEIVSASAVVSTTDATPSVADETPAPGPYGGDGKPKINDPPVRTNRPDVPIAQSLKAGAGEHTPPDESEVGPDGRPVYDEKAASEKDEAPRVDADTPTADGEGDTARGGAGNAARGEGDKPAGGRRNR